MAERDSCEEGIKIPMRRCSKLMHPSPQGASVMSAPDRPSTGATVSSQRSANVSLLSELVAVMPRFVPDLSTNLMSNFSPIQN